MDLNESPEHRAYPRESPIVVRAEQARPAGTLEERRAWHRKLYDAGFVGMGWPKAYGGQEASPIEQAIVGEEMTRSNAPGTINGLGIGFIGPTLIAHGTEEQKQRYVKKILTAEELWCQLYSEPGSGSDLASLKTTAVRDGDHYVVNGQKVWSSQAYNADYAILLARTDTAAPKHKGISYFILDMHAPGVEVRRLKQITGGAEFCEEFLTNVKVPGGEPDRRGGRGLGAGPDDPRLRARRQPAGPRDPPQDGAEPPDRGLPDDAAQRRHRHRRSAGAPEDRQDDGGDSRCCATPACGLLSKLQKGERPGPESSVDKLYYSEMDKRHQELILEILGPYGQMFEGLPEELSLDLRGHARRRGLLGATTSSGRAPARSTPARPRSRRTSSASAC